MFFQTNPISTVCIGIITTALNIRCGNNAKYPCPINIWSHAVSKHKFIPKQTIQAANIILSQVFGFLYNTKPYITPVINAVCVNPGKY